MTAFDMVKFWFIKEVMPLAIVLLLVVTAIIVCVAAGLIKDTVHYWKWKHKK